MRETTGTKRGFRPGPGRLNFAERLMGYGVLVLLTLLFCVLYLPGASSAQKARDNVVGVIYETENYTVEQKGTDAGKVSHGLKDNIAGDMYRPETKTGGLEKSKNGEYKLEKVPALNISSQSVGVTGDSLIYNVPDGSYFMVDAQLVGGIADDGFTIVADANGGYFEILEPAPRLGINRKLGICEDSNTGRIHFYCYSEDGSQWLGEFWSNYLNMPFTVKIKAVGNCTITLNSSGWMLNNVRIQEGPISGSGAANNIATLNHDDREGSYIADPVDAATGAHVIRR